MALNPAVLATAIETQMLANPACGAQPGPALTALATAIATAVVAHITTAGVVTPTALVAPSGGGPVTGTGNIT